MVHKKLLDGDKTGKFTFNDVKIRAGQTKGTGS